ncbi:MAG: threonine synthase [Bacteroidota bacterium]
MKLYSTRNRDHVVSFAEAVDTAMAPDGGLYMPCELPPLPPEFLEEWAKGSFQEIALNMARHLLNDEIPDDALEQIVREALNFPVPVQELDIDLSVLELFHGPTLAFKDFGARFMARVLAWLHRDDSREVTVLVATSGDTGGAVASGFAGVKGVRVVLLYPGGRVSPLQELQLTTPGENITTLKVDGTFDDCQRLVKQAFADRELAEKRTLTSANSINIARLLPQMFYYAAAWARVNVEDRAGGEDRPSGRGVVFVVPSGNFGNLTAGLMAAEMGIPVERFVMATNINDVVPDYFRTGTYRPRRAERTLSSAMDVGDPSNLARIRSLFDEDLEAMRRRIHTDSSTDEETREATREAFSQYRYVFDPHGAVGYGAARRFLDMKQTDGRAVVLATAHPAKFPEAMDEEMRSAVRVPEVLREIATRPKKMVPISADYEEFRSHLA